MVANAATPSALSRSPQRPRICLECRPSPVSRFREARVASLVLAIGICQLIYRGPIGWRALGSNGAAADREGYRPRTGDPERRRRQARSHPGILPKWSCKVCRPARKLATTGRRDRHEPHADEEHWAGANCRQGIQRDSIKEMSAECAGMSRRAGGSARCKSACSAPIRRVRYLQRPTPSHVTSIRPRAPRCGDEHGSRGRRGRMKITPHSLLPLFAWQRDDARNTLNSSLAKRFHARR